MKTSRLSFAQRRWTDADRHERGRSRKPRTDWREQTAGHQFRINALLPELGERFFVVLLHGRDSALRIHTPDELSYQDVLGRKTRDRPSAR